VELGVCIGSPKASLVDIVGGMGGVDLGVKKVDTCCRRVGRVTGTWADWGEGVACAGETNELPGGVLTSYNTCSDSIIIWSGSLNGETLGGSCHLLSHWALG